MKNIVSVQAVTIFCATTSCAQKDIGGGSKVTTIEKITIRYHGIAVSGPYDVELVSGQEGELVLKGEIKMLDNLETEVENGTTLPGQLNNVRYFNRLK